MGVCKVCGKEIANSLTGICDDCQKMLDTLTDKDVCETVYNETYGCLEDGGYYAVYSAINPDLFNDNSNKSLIEEICEDMEEMKELEADSQLDEKEFEITDDVDKIIADIDSDEEEGSEFYNDFKEASSNYRKFRLDIFNDKRHRDDYNKLMDFYRDDIENGTYKIGLASEIDNDTVVVDVSRGVVVYE